MISQEVINKLTKYEVTRRKKDIVFQERAFHNQTLKNIIDELKALEYEQITRKIC